MKSVFAISAALLLTGALTLTMSHAQAADVKVWHVIATKGQEFKVEGEKRPVITVRAGEEVHLAITAEKGPVAAKDGSVHSFTIKSLADQGWSLRLQPGTQEYTLKAPDKPGEYVIECTVLCGPHHSDQKMKLVVTP